MSNFTTISIISFVLVLASCSIDEATAPEKGCLIIASDFLETKDSSLFKNFSELKKIKITIKHLTTDSILSHFKKFNYTTKFDAVLLKSSYSLHQLSNAGVLHELPQKVHIETKIDLKNVSSKNNWLAIGYDPYVLDFGDSLAVSMNYSELIKTKKWNPVLEKNEVIPFYSSLIEFYGRKKRNKAFEFISEMDVYRKWSKKDSLKLALYTLNKFSISHKTINQYSFPNQNGSGVFYDCIGFGIISHSSHFIECTTLINYLVRQQNNQAFTGNISVFPLINPNGRADYSYQNNYPKLANCPPREVAKQFRNVHRILKKINKNTSLFETSISDSSLMNQPKIKK
jgi:hypothetical protein